MYAGVPMPHPIGEIEAGPVQWLWPGRLALGSELLRGAIGAYALGDLPSGHYRTLDAEERQRLLQPSSYSAALRARLRKNFPHFGIFMR